MKKILLLVLSLFIILIGGIWLLSDKDDDVSNVELAVDSEENNDESIQENDDEYIQENDDEYIQENDDEYIQEKTDDEKRKLEVNILADNSSKYGVAEDSLFTLTFGEDMAESDVINGLIIEPSFDYSIEAVSALEYKIKPKSNLSRNTVYRFSFKDLDFGKAFQTSDSLKIYESYPGEGAENVPLESGIEISFNSENVIDIEKHFTISPEVSGVFKYEKEKVIFLSDGLEKDTEYKITINVGVKTKDGSRELEEQYEFTFNTGKSSYFNTYERHSFMNTLYGNAPIIPISSWEKIRVYDVEIFKSDSFADFKNSHDHYLKYQSKELSFDNYSEVFNGEITSFVANSVPYLELPDNLERGRYIVKIEGDNFKHYVFMQVGDHQIYYAKAVNGEFIWMVDGKNSKPASGASVYSGDELVGRTNGDGVLFLTGDMKRDKESDYIVSVDGSDYIINSRDVNHRYYDNNANNYSHDHWAFLYTDRTVFRSTDTINIFAFVRSYTDEKIKNAKIVLTRYWADDVYLEKEVEVSDESSVTTSFDIKDFEFGYYNLKFIVDDKLVASTEISIRDYEKPEITIDSSVDKKIIFSGDAINYNFTANYFNGLPYSNFSARITSGGIHGVMENPEIITTEKDGTVNVELNPIMNKSSWRPILYQIKAENNQAESTYLTTYEHLYVVPRDVMVQATVSESNNVAVLDINTNDVDISKFSGDFGANYENIKGSQTSNSLEVEVIETYYEKKFIRTIYDKIHKVSYDEYRYNEVKTNLGTFKTDTVDGSGSFEFALTPERRYEFRLSIFDKQNRKVTESVSFSGNFNNSYYGYSRYDFENDERKYSVGDAVTRNILSFGEPIEENDKDVALFLIMRNGIIDYIVTGETGVEFDFDGYYRPNIMLGGIYFDGVNMFIVPKYFKDVVEYDHSELEVNITGTTDKDSYLPGERVELDLEVRDGNNKLVDVDLNISVVDEAYLALFEDYFDISYKLHGLDHYDGILFETVSSVSDEGAFGAEGGEGGDGAFIRDDFKDTASFETIKIENGKGKYSFILPDNLTSWRFTLHAANKNLNYGKTKLNVNVRLPYFVRTLYDTNYTTGDEVYLNLRSEGYDLDSETPIKYTALLNGNEKETFVEKSHIGKGFANIPMDTLDRGTYEITVTGETGDFKDGIREEIVVKDTYLKFRHKKTYEVNKEYVPNAENGEAEVYFYNKEARDYQEVVFRSFSNDDIRLEEIVARFRAYEILKENFGDSGFYDTYGVTAYQEWNGGIKELLTGNPSVALTALIAGTDYGMEYFDKDKIIDYLSYALMGEELPDRLKGMVLWGLARQDQPVLLGINTFLEINEFENLKLDTKLYIIYALLDIGEYDRAKKYSLTALDEVSYEASLDHKELILAKTLARRLDDEKFEYISKVVKNTETESGKLHDTYSIERVYDLLYYTPEFKNTFVSYNLDGKAETLSLPGTSSERIKISKGSKFTVKDYKGEVFASEFYSVIGTDGEDYDSKTISLEKTYLSEDIRQGDLVEVEMKLRKYIRYGVVIYDIVPSGFEFAGMKETNNEKRYVRATINGKYLRFSYNRDAGSGEFSYYIRAVQLGKYHTENAAIQQFYKEELNFSDKVLLEVKPND